MFTKDVGYIPVI